MPFYLFKSSRLIAYSTPQAVQPMGSTSHFLVSFSHFLRQSIPVIAIKYYLTVENYIFPPLA